MLSESEFAAFAARGRALSEDLRAVPNRPAPPYIVIKEYPPMDSGEPYHRLIIYLVWPPLASRAFYMYLRNLMISAMPYVVIRIDMGAVMRYNARIENLEPMFKHIIHRFDQASGTVLARRHPAHFEAPEPLKIAYVPTTGHPILQGRHFRHAVTGEVMAVEAMPCVILNTHSELTRQPPLDGITTDLIVPTCTRPEIRHLLPWPAARKYFDECAKNAHKPNVPTRNFSAPGIMPFIVPIWEHAAEADFDPLKHAFRFEFQGAIGLRTSLEILVDIMARDIGLLYNSICAVNWPGEEAPSQGRPTSVGPTETIPGTLSLALNWANAVLFPHGYFILNDTWILIEVRPRAPKDASGGAPQPAFDYETMANFFYAQSAETHYRPRALDVDEYYTCGHAGTPIPYEAHIAAQQQLHQVPGGGDAASCILGLHQSTARGGADPIKKEPSEGLAAFAAIWVAHVTTPSAAFCEWLIDPSQYTSVSPQYRD